MLNEGDAFGVDVRGELFERKACCHAGANQLRLSIQRHVAQEIFRKFIVDHNDLRA